MARRTTLSLSSTLLALAFAVGGCAAAPRSAPSPQAALCDRRVEVAQLLDRRTLRLASGTIVQLVDPQLFLAAPSPDQPDYFALNEELVHYLKNHLEGRTVSGDLSAAGLALCGQDRVAIGTGLVAQGLLYLEQVTGPLETASLDQWRQLETRAKQQRRGLWKNGPVGSRPFERVARLTYEGPGGEQQLDEITSDGLVVGKGRRIIPERLTQLRAIVAESAIVLLPRHPNFWRLCCDTGGSWFRVYYPRREGAPQAADYIESPELETVFRRLFDEPGVF
jgi:hypothetical protein